MKHFIVIPIFILALFSCQKENLVTSFGNEDLFDTNVIKENTIIDGKILAEFTADIIHLKNSIIKDQKILQSKRNVITDSKINNEDKIKLYLANTSISFVNLGKEKYNVIYNELNRNNKFNKELAKYIYKVETGNKVDTESLTIELRGWNCHDSTWGGVWILTKTLIAATSIAAGCSTGVGCVAGTLVAVNEVAEIVDCIYS